MALEPITRQEKIIAGQDLTPITRMEKFLKNFGGGGGGGGVKPDWNQNDSTAADYVKNRPFYTGTPVETVLVEESTLSFFDNGGLYMTGFPSTFEAAVGETYKVSWDGTIYECTCVEANVIGNLSILGEGSDTGEPFIMIIRGGNENYIFTTDTSDSHTLSISGTVTEIVKIPAKFIDKNSSGYIAIHSNDTMTQQEAETYRDEISEKEVAFIIWDGMCINYIGFGGYSGDDLVLETQDCAKFLITKNDAGLFDFYDRKFDGAYLPGLLANGDAVPSLDFSRKGITVSPRTFYTGVGSTDTLFCVRPNGTKSKDFNVLGNGEAVTPALILYSSTADSTKKFRVTVDDSGTISATEVT